jgi:hypothetical protein
MAKLIVEDILFEDGSVRIVVCGVAVDKAVEL